MGDLQRELPTDRFDPLTGLVGFASVLRHAGTPADRHRTRTFLTALSHLDPASVRQVYWAGRLTLCAEPDDLPRYDAAFAAWFGGRPPPVVSRRRSGPRQPRMAAMTPQQAGENGAVANGRPLHVAASDTEVLRHRDLGELNPAERAHLRELFGTLRTDPPMRTAIRRRPARRGDLDSRRTLRAMLAAGGEPARLRYRSRSRRPRRLVLLIDISGSMSPYADALLRFAHVVVRASPASTEVFALGTRLTRLTRAMRQRDPERALLAASRAVPDFSGGTRLGETLRAFLDLWGQRGVARRASVVLFSDGWERGDPTLLATELGRLRRLAHAVFWVNPHAGRDGYAPVQSGIRAALPHIDQLLAGHSLATLQRLLAEVRDA